jgi:hypothetical protein
VRENVRHAEAVDQRDEGSERPTFLIADVLVENESVMARSLAEAPPSS